ncbi:MAG: plasmid mobilization protein [Eubacteriales bacterium]
MKKRKHNIPIMFWVTEQERDLIEQRMEQIGTANMSAYLRKIAIDGYILKLELPELKEILSLLRRSSNNLNQIAKRVNETGRVYDTDIECLLENQERLWSAANEILARLAALK